MAPEERDEIAKIQHAAAIAAEVVAQAAADAKSVISQAALDAVRTLTTAPREKDIKLYEDVASVKVRVEDQCDRLERVEKQLLHIDECIDGLRDSMSFWRGRMTAIAGLAAAGISIAVNKLWP